MNKSNKLKNLQITAYLGKPIALSDDYSPSIDALLEWLWLDERGLARTNPSPDSLIQTELPIKKGRITGEWLFDEWYWCVSSPHYQIEYEQTSRFRKRWDYQDKHLSWGKKKAKVQRDGGFTKNVDLPLFLRNTNRIDWFAVGDRVELHRLLEQCTHLGKARSCGYGEVLKWDVTEIENDWHLWRNGNLARPIPYEYFAPLNHKERLPMMSWAWRPPGWMDCNRELCVMPKHNVVKVKPKPIKNQKNGTT